MHPAAPLRYDQSVDLRGETGPGARHRHAALIAAGAIFSIHFALLAGSLLDYRVTIDSAYHVAMARQWGLQGWVLWDQVNFGPRGRPNLQGPLFQAAIGALGRLLGGTGADYVLANAIAALTQWTAAVLTAAFFALQLQGEWAALFAVSLLSGAVFASSSFAVGIPSGWLFILAGWAIWFFVRRRLAACALASALAIYMHIAGFATAPLAIVVAAALTRRWREMAAVGVLVALLTAPYAIHVLSNLDWFSGAQGHPALLFDPMLDLLAAAAALMLLRRPRENVVLIAWLAAPMVWLAHDPCRLILQSALAGSVAAGVALERAMRRVHRRSAALFLGCAIVTGASVFPLGMPALAAEITWDMGLRYPRAIDWRRSAELAAELERAGLTRRLVADYQPALCPALAVFAPLSCEKGHWVEVQPRRDPADDLSASDKVYILPIPADDPVLAAMQARGWLTRHGGAEDSSIVTLAPQLAPAAIAPAAAALIDDDAGWLGRNAVNNTIGVGNWRSVISQGAARRREMALLAQRVRAGRIELACLLYADSLQRLDPAQAHRWRRAARGFGVIASFLSDGFAVDYISAARLAAFKADLRAAAAVRINPGAPQAQLLAALERALANITDTQSGMFAQRPAGNLFPWLEGVLERTG